jgi:hypothetical protein
VSRETTKDNVETSLEEVTGCISKHLGLQGLACLAASSQQYKQNCLHTVRNNAALLLLDAIDTAATLQSQSQDADTLTAAAHTTAGSAVLRQTCMQASVWLLRAAPSEATAAKAAENIMRIPNVPLSIAQQLVAAGVRISFLQLKAASAKMVAGVEVWVQARQQLCVKTDIPAAIVELCCSDCL